ncbi:ABC transporter permease [Paenibacillus sp. HB172176]|uniref:ABC transporter permease n=1 Tax=Paenibacillus sp. HB172176 TaxID=2493690 RepID=UPI00143ADEA7|nr:ABC transporter permease [Paenibacillus sp. HB172176]
MNRLLFVVQFALKSLLRKKIHTLLLCLVTTLSLILPYSGILAFNVLNQMFIQTIVPGYENIQSLQINSEWYLQEGKDALQKMMVSEPHQKSVVYSSSIGTLTDKGYSTPSYLMLDPEGLDLLNIHVSEGRKFTKAETDMEQRVALISETYSKKIDYNTKSKLYIDGLAFDIIGIYQDKGKSVILPFSTYLRWKTERLKESLELYIKTENSNLVAQISDRYGHEIIRITSLKDKINKNMKSSNQLRTFIYVVVCVIFAYSLINILSYLKFKILHEFHQITVQILQGAQKKWIIIKLMLEYVYIFMASSLFLSILHFPIIKALNHFYIYPHLELIECVYYLSYLFLIYLMIGLLSLYPVFRLRPAISQRMEGF